jgi:hypothetical protein
LHQNAEVPQISTLIPDRTQDEGTEAEDQFGHRGEMLCIMPVKISNKGDEVKSEHHKASGTSRTFFPANSRGLADFEFAKRGD